MATLLSTALNDARALLLDQTTPYRYPDADLVGYVNNGVATMYRLRPDFHLSAVLPTFSVGTLTAEIPDFIVSEGFYPALIDFVVHRAQMRDDQYVDEGISAVFIEKFRAQLLGLGA